MEYLDFKSFVLHRFRNEYKEAALSESVTPKLLDEWCSVINKELRSIGERPRGVRGIIVNELLKEYDTYAFGVTPVLQQKKSK